jgi:hypothetical protein
MTGAAISLDYNANGSARNRALWRAGIVGGILAFLYAVPLPMNPTYQLCGFHWLTGHPCPFCGLTRSLSFLLRGEWRLSLALHPLGPFVLVSLLAVLILDVVSLNPSFSERRADRVRFSRFCWIGFAILFSACGVLRWI